MFAPLRVALFRTFWTATMVSNFGWVIQSVAAGWLMTVLAGTPDMVALVQVAVQAPLLCFSLLAGVAADLFDRRRILLVAQSIMLVAGALLSLLTFYDLIAPWSLLLFTFVLGAGTALQGPAYQSLVRELVPGPDLPQAVLLNGVSFNLARSLGPALGGLIIAVSSVGAAFLVNVISYLPLITALAFWRRAPQTDDLPRERMGSAALTGLRYASETRSIRYTLVRVVVFSLAASAAMPLLPLVARDTLGGGPLTFGLLLGAFGVGAMGSAFLIHPLRQRFGAPRVTDWLSIVFGIGMLLLAFGGYMPLMMLGLAGAGAAWIGTFSFFNIVVQTASAFWVQSRTFAIYQTVMFGTMTLGSWLWGEAAHFAGLSPVFAAAGILLLLSPLLGKVAPLSVGELKDLAPARPEPDPSPALNFDHRRGPVLVMREYRVDVGDAETFDTAMEEVGHLRKRNGALRWRLYQDIMDAEHWVESFVVASWLEYRRQARRATAADVQIEATALRFHKAPEPPIQRQLLSRERL